MLIIGKKMPRHLTQKSKDFANENLKLRKSGTWVQQNTEWNLDVDFYLVNGWDTFKLHKKD